MYAQSCWIVRYACRRVESQSHSCIVTWVECSDDHVAHSVGGFEHSARLCRSMAFQMQLTQCQFYTRPSNSQQQMSAQMRHVHKGQCLSQKWEFLVSCCTHIVQREHCAPQDLSNSKHQTVWILSASLSAHVNAEQTTGFRQCHVGAAVVKSPPHVKHWCKTLIRRFTLAYFNMSAFEPH